MQAETLKTFKITPQQPPLLDGFECPCSMVSSNIALEVRVALSKGLRSFYLRVSIRAYREVRFARIRVCDSLGSGYAIRSAQGSRPARDNGRVPLGSDSPTRASVSVPLERVCLSHSGNTPFLARGTPLSPLGEDCVPCSGGIDNW